MAMPVNLVLYYLKMVDTMDKPNTNPQGKSGFASFLSEEDSPEIGIATKEPLGDYFKGVKTEYKKISWPTQEQAKSEFIAVVVIVAIITVAVFLIDLGIEKVVGIFK